MSIIMPSSNWLKSKNIDSATRKVFVEKYTYEQSIIEKWNHSGLLGGLTGPIQSNISQLLENQAKELMKEQNVPFFISSRGFDSKPKKNLKKLKFFFVSVWELIFKKKNKEVKLSNIAFPIVRRVFAQTIALDLVPIMPMQAPQMIFAPYIYSSVCEPENVYTRIVLIEKYKPIFSRYATKSINERYYGTLSFDYFDDKL
jgi:hypothetical protein